MSLSAATAPRPQRALWPREHGAYAELGFPLLTALVLGRPGLSSVLLTVAAMAAFLAHEPLLVLLGHRGRKALARDEARAHRALAYLGSLGAMCAGAGLALANPATRTTAALVAVPIVTALIVVVRKAERSGLGEGLAAASLAAMAAPVAVASGVSPHMAAIVWATWSLAFALTTASVRSLIHRAKEPTSSVIGTFVLPSAVAIAWSALAWHRWIPAVAAIALVPHLLVTAAIALRPPPARALRQVGFIMLVASALAATVLGVGLNRAGLSTAASMSVTKGTMQ